MQFQGGMDLQALAALNNIDLAEGEAPAIGGRAFDSDGDGRPDLYVVDLDADGAVDGVVKAFDTDGDGANDTFIQYKEDGSVQSIGRVDAATGELDVVYEEPPLFEEILAALGLIDLPSPEEALFGSFESPYFMDTFGTYGEEVPDFYLEPDEVEDFTVSEVSPEAAEAMEMGAPGTEMDIDASEASAAEGGVAAGVEAGVEAGPEPSVEPTASEAAADVGGPEPAPPEVTPRITEIEDRSGGAGSSLWTKVDQDGDGLADYDTRIEGTSTGTFYGDINKDGYSEEVAADLDMDGRLDTVNTTGQGAGADVVGAGQIVEPGSGHLVDQVPGEDDDAAMAAGAVDTGDPDAGVYDSGDAGADGIATGSDYDAGSVDSGGYDSGSSYDSGSAVDTSTTDPDPD